MKKLFLTSAILAIIAFPTFADNITSSNNDCVNDTLTTYSGSATLEADWSPNTVNVTYYNGDDVYGNAGSCTYDDTLTLPNAPSKDGYIFNGWTVKLMGFDLSTLLNYMSENSNIYAGKSITPGAYCEGIDGTNNWFGHDEGQDCSDSRFSHLDNGEWSMTLENGTIKGDAVCASNEGTYARTGTPQGTEGQYCWCRVTGFAASNSSDYRPVTSPLWVFNYAYNDANACANRCPYYCVGRIRTAPDFRQVMYGGEQ